MKDRIANHELLHSVLLLLTLQDAASCLKCGQRLIRRVCEPNNDALIGGHGTIMDEISGFTGKLLLIKGQDVALSKIYQGLTNPRITKYRAHFM